MHFPKTTWCCCVLDGDSRPVGSVLPSASIAVGGTSLRCAPCVAIGSTGLEREARRVAPLRVELGDLACSDRTARLAMGPFASPDGIWLTRPRVAGATLFEF